jgi:hypothetical protein
VAWRDKPEAQAEQTRDLRLEALEQRKENDVDDHTIIVIVNSVEHPVLDDITADLFNLDARAVPVLDMTGSNTTTDCTDNGCSGNCTSVGCTTNCR